MKRQYFCLLMLLTFDFSTLWANQFSTFISEDKVEGPVCEIVEISFDYLRPQKTVIEKEVNKRLKKETYSIRKYDKRGFLIESMDYKNKKQTRLMVSKQSESSEYVFHRFFLNSKGEQESDYREVIAYNMDGSPIEIVYMRGTIITAQERYEYNEKGQIITIYRSLKDEPEYIDSDYSYDAQGRLIEDRAYFKGQVSRGNTWQYSDSVVRKNGYWGLNAEERGTPESSIIYLDNEGKVVREFRANGNGNYTEIKYLEFDQYGNWIDKIVSNYRYNGSLIKLGDIEPNGVHITDATLYLHGDEKKVKRYIRKIKYYK